MNPSGVDTTGTSCPEVLYMNDQCDWANYKLVVMNAVSEIDKLEDRVQKVEIDLVKRVQVLTFFGSVLTAALTAGLSMLLN